MPKNTNSQKIWLEYVSSSWSIWGMDQALSGWSNTGSDGSALAAPPNSRNGLGDEDQDHRDDERQQTEKFGSGEADEQAALLTVGSAGVAQRAFVELTKDVTHANRGHTGTDCCKACADELGCFCFHCKNSLKIKSVGKGG